MSIAKCTLSCCNSTDSQGKCGSEARRGKKNAGRYRTLFLLLLHCSRASHCYFCTWLLFPEYMLVYMVWNETNVQFCWPDTRINGLLLFICNVLLHVWAVLENLPDEKPENFKKKVGIQLRKTGILQTLWSSFPLEQVCCQCCFECSCCCVPTVRRNDETIVLRKCVISWCLAAALFLDLHSSISHT